jgi:hypothetical protein
VGLGGAAPTEFILRFTQSHPDLHTTIVGTANVVAEAKRGLIVARQSSISQQSLDAAHARA